MIPKQQVILISIFTRFRWTGGFFIGYFRCGDFGKSDLFVYNFRDEAGTMVNYAGVKMDPDIIQGTGGPGGCSFYHEVLYRLC